MSEVTTLQFALTEGERHHPLWTKLETHLRTRLMELRSKNDGALSDHETQTLRGRIGCLKELIALGEDPPMTGE